MRALRAPVFITHDTKETPMFKPIACALAAQLLCASAAMAVAPTISGPARPDQAMIEAGAKRFNQSCVYCHGNAGSGGKAAPLQGRDDLTKEYVMETIANGKQRGAFNMPAWKGAFNEQQIQELTAYILSLKNAGAAK
jgi:mono/diheme cytochrome c family protein